MFSPFSSDSISHLCFSPNAVLCCSFALLSYNVDCATYICWYFTFQWTVFHPTMLLRYTFIVENCIDDSIVHRTPYTTIVFIRLTECIGIVSSMVTVLIVIVLLFCFFGNHSCVSITMHSIRLFFFLHIFGCILMFSNTKNEAIFVCRLGPLELTYTVLHFSALFNHFFLLCLLFPSSYIVYHLYSYWQRNSQDAYITQRLNR